ncbi:MAG: aldo/keto reductase [Pseudomonadota bacterium]
MRTIVIEGIATPASVVGLGTMIFHPDTADRDHGLLDAFVDGGGTFIDTAEVYGAVEEHGYSEMVIGDWLASRPGMRDRIVLVSKGLIPGYCAPLHPGGASISPAQIHRAIDGSLERLKTAQLDLWMFHRDDPDLDVGPLVDALYEEIGAGRIKAWGASNWTTDRLQAAMDYAAASGKAAPVASSPNFSLAKANEPYWPDTVTTSDDDRAWYARHQMPLVAWSSLGRGFFSRGNTNDRSDQDLVRVFYSDGNFQRKRRATELANAKNLSMFEIAIAYVTSQAFPSVALCGARTVEQVKDASHAGDLVLSQQERDWLDLTSDENPI